jgi:hypothetical protein
LGARSDPRVMATERIAPGALPRVLGSFEMTVIFIAIVLFIVRVSRSGALYVSGGVGIVASAVGAVVAFKTPSNPDRFSNGSWRLWLGLMTAVSAGAAVVIHAISEWMRRRHEAPDAAEAPVT